MFKQSIRLAAGAALEARLKRPDFPHIGDKTLLDCELFALLVQREVDRSHECGDGVIPPGDSGLPTRSDLLPKQRGKQKPWANTFTFPHSLVGSGQGNFNKPRALRLFQDDIEEREQTVV
jgi:hypothetical protein